MANRTLTLGDVELPRIGLGTNRLANTPENVAFLRAAVDAGVRMIDTAHLYTGGDSEQTIGAALAPFADGLVVATKGGHAGAKPDVLRSEIEESLRRLRTDTIALYYLHRVDPETPIEESLAAIAEYRGRGAIRHVGISNVTVEQIERARQVVPVAAVQNHYSVSERKYDSVVDYCTEHGIVFVPYFPLRGVDEPPRVALRWLLERSPATLPIPGTLSLEHLKENLGALGGLD
jgi:aryl-alcohol dehydrogenase-like predicted oxidoreductase